MDTVDVVVIITEKPNISATIAKSIIPKGENVQDYLIADSFQVVTGNANKKNHFYYENKIEENKYLQPISFQSRKRNKKSNRVRDLEGSSISSKDSIRYYAIESKGMIYIICDTAGNMMSLGLNSGIHRLDRLIVDNKKYQDFSKNLRLFPQQGAWARGALFRQLLSKRKLPCNVKSHKINSRINIKNVIAATDYDVAGQYIFYSVVLYCKLHETELYTQYPLSRLDMAYLEPGKIQESLRNPKTFDLNMALAGDARSKQDYIYGAFSGELRYRLRRLEGDKPKQSISFGRVQSLALKSLISKEDEIIKGRGAGKFIYFIFKGRLGLKELEKQFKNGKYAWVQLDQVQRAVSHASFLKECQSNNVGTHTTRYTLLDKLVQKGLAVKDDSRVVSTEYGLIFSQWLDRLMKNKPMSVDTVNARLVSFIEEMKPLDDEQSLQMYSAYLNKFYIDFRGFLIESKKDGRIDEELKNFLNIDISNTSKRSRISTKQVNSEAPGFQERGAIAVRGLNGCISRKEVKNIYEGRTSATKIKRYIPKPKFDYLPTIKRVCCIDRGMDVGFLGWGNIGILQELEEEKWTVFRMKTNDPVTKNVIAKIAKASFTGHEDIDVISNISNVKKEVKDQGRDAHSPLQVKGIKRGTIKGPTGLLLIKEYNYPWLATKDKEQRKGSGGINPASLSLTYIERKNAFMKIIDAIRRRKPEMLSFDLERVESYETGRVHNFEGLLIAMSRKYGVPFNKTANLAQEAYLS